MQNIESCMSINNVFWKCPQLQNLLPQLQKQQPEFMEPVVQPQQFYQFVAEMESFNAQSGHQR